MAQPPEPFPGRVTKVSVATSVRLTFISFWCAAAIVLNDPVRRCSLSVALRSRRSAGRPRSLPPPPKISIPALVIVAPWGTIR